MRTLAIVAMLLFAVTALAEAPCIEPKVTAPELKAWKIVSSKFNVRRQRITVAVNPDPLAEIKSAFYAEVKVAQIIGSGTARPIIVLFQFCYLDNDVVRDFGYRFDKKCWVENDTSKWPEEVKANVRKTLLKALNGEVI